MILEILKSYERVIADLKSQEPFCVPNAMDEALATLNERVDEIREVYADELAQELKELGGSMRRHPANNGGKLPTIDDL